MTYLNVDDVAVAELSLQSTRTAVRKSNCGKRKEENHPIQKPVN